MPLSATHSVEQSLGIQHNRLTSPPKILGLGKTKTKVYISALDPASCERRRIDVMKITPADLHLTPLGEAIDLWWENIKKPTVRKPRSIEAYDLYRKNLKRLLGSMTPAQLHIGTLIEYQHQRHGIERASVSYVNHETNMLSQMMRYADLWTPIERHFKPLPPPDWTPPKVLTAEEEERFFRVVAAQVNASDGNHPWAVAYWAVSLTNNTSAMGAELRNLQLKHIFLHHDPPKIHVPDGKVKNEFRARVIPLNEVALKRMGQLVDRAQRLARKQGYPDLQPDHFIFPYAVWKNGFDVTRPATRWFIRKAFVEMREATGFTWLNPRNFRNQVITKLFEVGIPDETIISIAGHQSIKMSRYYSRIRLDAKKEALSAIGSEEKPGKGRVTCGNQK